jgi:hypothetical protein
MEHQLVAVSSLPPYKRRVFLSGCSLMTRADVRAFVNSKGVAIDVSLPVPLLLHFITNLQETVKASAQHLYRGVRVSDVDSSAVIYVKEGEDRHEAAKKLTCAFQLINQINQLNSN